MKYIAPLIVGITFVVGIAGLLTQKQIATQNAVSTVHVQGQNVGGFSDPFLSLQVGTSPTNGYVLQTDGTDSAWVATTTLGFASGSQTISTSTPLADTEVIYGTGVNTIGSEAGFTYDDALNKLTVPYASTTAFSVSGRSYFNATSTWPSGINNIMHGIYAVDSSGLHIHSNNGTEVAFLGAGGGANSTFYGGVNIDGTTRLATSLSGALSASSGTVSAGTLSIANGGTNASSFATTNGIVHYNGTSLITDSDFTYNGSILAAGDGTGTSTISGNLDVVGDIKADTFYAVGKIINQGDITASYYTASSSSATSTLPQLSVTEGISLMGEYFENFTTYVRSLFTAGTGLTVAAGQIAIDLASNLTWTGAHNFGGATSLEIPNGASPTVDAVGEIALDTTDNQLLIATSTNATYPAVFRSQERLFGFTLASTSPEFVSGGQIPVPLEKDGYTVTNLKCYVQSGTSVVMTLTDGTNAMDSLTCATTATTDDGSIANNTVTANELMYVNVGTVTGVPDYVTFSAFGSWLRE